jgi:hypothetical protein
LLARLRPSYAAVMQGIHRVLFLALAVYLAGCAKPRPNLLPTGTKVTIVEFGLADGVKVEDYNAPYDQLGADLAQVIAERLRRKKCCTVEVAPATVSAPEGDVIVTGEITRISGGSAAKRWLLPGGGHSTFGAQGEVRKADGTKVASFSHERVARGAGGNVSSLHWALEVTGTDIGEMVWRGEYKGGRPGSPGYLAQARAKEVPTQRPAAERLRELDKLREQGLVNEDEYREKRRRIIDEF